MKCLHCGRSPNEHGVTLFRLNPKGEKGVWTCESCTPWPPVDNETKKVVAALESLINPSH